MKKSIVLSILFVLLFACSSRNRLRPIPEKDLVPLLVDLHVSDALALNSTIVDNFGALDSAILYSTVLDKHGYSKEELLFTLDFYTKTPEKLMEIYDNVFATLSRMSEEAKAEYASYSIENTTAIWKPDKPRIILKGDDLDYPGPYTIKISDTGTYVLNINIKLSKSDKSVNPKVIAYFYDPADSAEEKREYFEEINLNKSKYSREYLLLKSVSDTSLSLLKLIVPKVENSDSSFFKELTMDNLRVSKVIFETVNDTIK